MNLGGDSDSSKQAFIDAMKDRLKDLNEEKPEDKDIKEKALKEIDDPEGNAHKNLGALGQAVYNILTENAEIVSSPDETDHRSIWDWIQGVNSRLQALSEWQQGVRDAFDNWSPDQPPPTDSSEPSEDELLKAAILALPTIEPLPSLPTEIRGRIE